MTYFMIRYLGCLRMNQSIAWLIMVLNPGNMKLICCIANDKVTIVRCFLMTESHTKEHF